jgi:hypothetical protein
MNCLQQGEQLHSTQLYLWHKMRDLLLAVQQPKNLT